VVPVGTVYLADWEGAPESGPGGKG